MNIKSTLVVSLITLLCSTNATARSHAFFGMDDEFGNSVEVLENGKTFTMDGEFGFSATSGNTTSSSSLIKLNAKQILKDWNTQYVVEGFHKKQEAFDAELGRDVEQTAAQKIFFSGQGDYKLTNPSHRLFAFSSYENDRFSNFDFQATIAAGWSQEVWNDEKSNFKYSIGPGYSIADDLEGNEVNGFIVRSSAEYVWNISETATFRQSVSSELGDENTKSKSETALTAKINGSLAMSLSYVMNHNSEVAEDKKNLDSIVAVTLVYSFF